MGGEDLAASSGGSRATRRRTSRRRPSGDRRSPRSLQHHRRCRRRPSSAREARARTGTPLVSCGGKRRTTWHPRGAAKRPCSPCLGADGREVRDQRHHREALLRGVAGEDLRAPARGGVRPEERRQVGHGEELVQHRRPDRPPGPLRASASFHEPVARRRDREPARQAIQAQTQCPSNRSSSLVDRNVRPRAPSSAAIIRANFSSTTLECKSSAEIVTPSERGTPKPRPSLWAASPAPSSRLRADPPATRRQAKSSSSVGARVAEQ